MNHFPDNILTALKEAVINVFWKKKDVKELFNRCKVQSALIQRQDWNGYKYNFVSPILDSLNQTASGLGPLRNILQETLQYKDGNHLLWLQDGQKHKKDAERSLEHLRLLVEQHDSQQEHKKEEQQQRMSRIQKQKNGIDFNNKLNDIKNRFIGYCGNPEAQQRGYQLEDILYDLFLLFEMSPKSPFKRTGEQIDGAFKHEGDHFLLEAKWQKHPSILHDLRDLDGAVSSSLDNTLGLFVSINGFSKEALEGYLQGNRPRIICMDGMDLMAIVDSRIDLADLIQRKKDIAAHKRIIFACAKDILTGRY